MLLQGKTAIITGCSKGIGKSLLQTFAQNQCNIWACSRKPTEEFEVLIEQLTSKYNVNIRPLYFDLAEESEIKEAMSTIFSSKQNIDILVNNAGVTSPNALFLMTPIQKMKEVFQINFFSQIILTQYVTRLMVKQKSGSIINISSIAGIDGDPGQLEYVSSKAAMIGATKKLANELATYNIRVNAIAPGITETDMIDQMSNEILNVNLTQTNMKRLGHPNEIASAALFLASSMSSFMTGQVLRVDGGR
ncbi:SDR family NAD(P)-dependent oxidoreductase [Paenibacillus sp. GXUN7292]|uniref:SDR family NAD(P)-dependent oxidoreductase n=1 Tax=Paenibacillus sp. GXUN7292 TaxID=3422499 RepID=UPI003D7D5CBE